MKEWAATTPSGPLAPYATSIVGYRLEGFPPGTHIGMPSGSLTLVISLSEPLELSGSFVRGRQHFAASIAGLHAAPVTIHHDGSQHGIQLALTPAGARALFGLPASELASAVVHLDQVFGRGAHELLERLQAAAGWQRRLAVVEEALVRAIGARGPGRDEVVEAWSVLERSHGRAPIAALADHVGWSRRHLAAQFRAEFGHSPKTAGRVLRFERSRSLLSAGGHSIADVAAECGYADQAHLTREWRDLAGTTPGHWAEDDEFAFVQDMTAVPG